MNVPSILSSGIGLALTLPLIAGGGACAVRALRQLFGLQRATRTLRALSEALDQAIEARAHGAPSDRHRADLRIRQLHLRLYRSARVDPLARRRHAAGDPGAVPWFSFIVPSVAVALYGWLGAIGVSASMLAAGHGLREAVATGSALVAVGGLMALPGMLGHRALVRRIGAFRSLASEIGLRMDEHDRPRPALWVVPSPRDLERTRAA